MSFWNSFYVCSKIEISLELKKTILRLENFEFTLKVFRIFRFFFSQISFETFECVISSFRVENQISSNLRISSFTGSARYLSIFIFYVKSSSKFFSKNPAILGSILLFFLSFITPCKWFKNDVSSSRFKHIYFPLPYILPYIIYDTISL